MSQTASILVKDRDRYSRTGTLTIGEKLINIPNFCTRIKGRMDFNVYLNAKTLSPIENSNSLILRLSDAPDQLLPTPSRIAQFRLDMETFSDQKIRDFYRNNLILIDPCSEYLWYEDDNRLLSNLKRITKDTEYAINIINYLEEKKEIKKVFNNNKKFRNWKRKAHNDFWYTLDRNRRLLFQTIGEIQDIEILCKADVFLPFVPIINNKSMLDISIRINNVVPSISRIESATYLILHNSVLKKDNLINDIISYIATNNSRITVLKIKNMELWESGNIAQRENYRSLMRRMAEISYNDKNKSFFLLEGSHHCYPSAAVGFDVVSSSLNGLDKDSSFGTNTRGSWYNSKILYPMDFDSFKILYKNNKHRPPCDCPACTSIQNISIENIQTSLWSKIRREHYIYAMNELMRNIVSSINLKQIELIQNQIINSEISKLGVLVPRY